MTTTMLAAAVVVGDSVDEDGKHLDIEKVEIRPPMSTKNE